MTWFTACVLYALIWWTTLFAILPLGIRPNPQPDPETGWRGAPSQPRIRRKLILTTLVSLAIWAACAALIASPYLSFRHGWLALPNDQAE